MQGNVAGEVDSLKKTVGIGHQNFEQLILNDNFYIDKTAFIKEWWESNDIVTLITRPRRFGKTLNMSMLERVLKIIPAICTPHFAVDLCQIQVT